MATTSAQAPATPSIRLQLFGAPALWVGDRNHPLDRHLAALLLMLATEGAIARSDAAQRLWPEAEPANARNSLRQRLHKVRLLHPRIIEGLSVLTLHESVATDLAVTAPPDEGGDCSEADRLLSGMVYPGNPELMAWIDAARAHWRRQRTAWLDQEAARLELDGRLEDALGYLDALMALDRLDEAIHRRVIRLHYLQGNGTAALRVYERLITALQAEMGKPPDPETRQLAHVISDGAHDMQSAKAPPVSLERPPRLIGRERELAWLKRQWGGGVRVLLTGEAGIGKSRFIEAAMHRHGGETVSARPSDQGVAFALLTRLVSKLLGRVALPEGWIGATLAPFRAGSPQHADDLRSLTRIQQALTAWLNDPRFKGCCLCIDDLHFADAASLEVIVASALEPTGPAWLLSCREAELPEQLAPVQSALSEAVGFAHLSLQPLDEVSTTALVESLSVEACAGPEWGRSLFRRTGGRPLFILETVRQVLEKRLGRADFDAHIPIAPSLQWVLQARLGRLSSSALGLARVFAVADADFQIDLATSLLGCSTVDLVGPMAELEGAQIVRGRGFAHDLIRAAIIQGIPQIVREALHAQVAEWLTHRQAAWSRIGRHWEAAAHWAEAGRALEFAGDRAVNANRAHEGEQLWQRSLTAYERAGDCDGMVNALCALVRLALIRASLDDAERLCCQLSGLAKTERNRRYALHLMADTALRAQDYRRAAECAQELLQTAESIGDAEAAFNARRKLAGALAHSNRGEEALSTHAAMRPYVEGREHHQSVRVFFCDVGVVQELAGDAREAEGSLRAAITHNLLHKDQLLARRAWTNLAGNLWRRGMSARAAEAAQQAHALTQQMELTLEQTLPDAAERQAMLRDAGDLAAAWQVLLPLSPLIEAAPRDALLEVARTHAAMSWHRFGRRDQALHLLPVTPPRRPSTLVTAHRRAAFCELARWHGGDHADPPEAESSNLEFSSWVAQAVYLLTLSGWTEPSTDSGAMLCLVERAGEHGLCGLELHARLLAVESCGQEGAMRRSAVVDLLERADASDPYLLYKPEFWWRCLCVLAGVTPRKGRLLDPATRATLSGSLAGDPVGERAVRNACAWIHRNANALSGTHFAESFLQRNPVNTAVLALERQMSGSR